MKGRGRFIRTRWAAFAAVWLTSAFVLAGLYAVLSQQGKSLLERYKEQYYSEQAYRMASVVRTYLTEAPTPASIREKLESTSKLFSTAVRYYGPDQETILYEYSGNLSDFSIPSERLYEVQIPVIVNGGVQGYINAYFDKADEYQIASLANWKQDSERKMQLAFAVALLASLLLSIVISGRLSAPLRNGSRQVQPILKGDRDKRLIPEGTSELRELYRTINVLMEDVNQQEIWRKRMLVDLTHELRTPLTSVLSRLEAILDGVYPKTEEHLQSMYDEIDRLSRLVDNMEKLSEAETARFKLNIQRVQMTKIVKGIHDAYLFLAKEKNMKFLFHHPNTPCIAEVDPDRIIQILSNIISNAIKYTPDGGTVEVGLSSNESETLIYCSDNGIGISEEDLPHIFKRFFRADPSRSRDIGGLGVGLSIVKALVEAHGGTIEVKSQVGRGSTFLVRIPHVIQRMP